MTYGPDFFRGMLAINRGVLLTSVANLAAQRRLEALDGFFDMIDQDPAETGPLVNDVPLIVPLETPIDGLAGGAIEPTKQTFARAMMVAVSPLHPIDGVDYTFNDPQAQSFDRVLRAAAKLTEGREDSWFQWMLHEAAKCLPNQAAISKILEKCGALHALGEAPNGASKALVNTLQAAILAMHPASAIAVMRHMDTEAVRSTLDFMPRHRSHQNSQPKKHAEAEAIARCLQDPAIAMARGGPLDLLDEFEGKVGVDETFMLRSLVLSRYLRNAGAAWDSDVVDRLLRGCAGVALDHLSKRVADEWHDETQRNFGSIGNQHWRELARASVSALCAPVTRLFEGMLRFDATSGQVTAIDLGSALPDTGVSMDRFRETAGLLKEFGHDIGRIGGMPTLHRLARKQPPQTIECLLVLIELGVDGSATDSDGELASDRLPGYLKETWIGTIRSFRAREQTSELLGGLNNPPSPSP